MEVILLEKIRNLGNLGDKVKVPAGFGRNYLVPQGKAVYANAENIVKFEERRALLEQQAAEKIQAAKERQQSLQALGTIIIKGKAGEEGKLFGSIGTRDIADIINDKGVNLQKSEIHLPMGAFRQVGEYDIEVELHSDVRTIIKINIVAE